MRSRYLVAVALACGFGALANTPSPAQSVDYPYCLQGRGPGYPGDCSFRTYEQCQASASGRNVGCGINPRVAFQRDGRGNRDPRYDRRRGARYDAQMRARDGYAYDRY